jgi:hypothetical protein
VVPANDIVAARILRGIIALGPRPIGEFVKFAETRVDESTNSRCFVSRLILRRVNFLTAWLHNQTPVEMQMRLHLPRQTDGALADECRINAGL